MTQRYYTTKTAAERMEVAPVTVRLWCEQGRLPAIKLGKLWKIPVAAVEERLARALQGRGEVLADGRA